MSLALPGTRTSSDARPSTRYSSEGLEQSQGLFSSDELRQFASDDAEAGRRIGKILAALFVYTVIVMSVAIFWTLRTVGH